MKRTLLAASVAVLLFAGFAEVLYAAPDLRREEQNRERREPPDGRSFHLAS